MASPTPGGGPRSDLLEQVLADQRAGWPQGQCILVEEYLARHPGLLEHHEALLDLIYNEIVLREQNGEKPGPDDYASRFPELDSAIRDQFEIHRMFATQRSDPDRTPTFSVGSSSSEGLRYRVLRPHRKGGLGAVFVALDSELHREVALKQILDHHADDPVSRSRFLVEAEITGGLEHPGIVPVYGLGHYANGRPFYAMRFISWR
jgi:serine/threonine protein kinase